MQDRVASILEVEVHENWAVLEMKLSCSLEAALGFHFGKIILICPFCGIACSGVILIRAGACSPTTTELVVVIAAATGEREELYL